MIYKVEFMRVGYNSWSHAADTNSEQQAISRAKSVAREPNREKVRVVDSKGTLIWMS